MTGSRVMKRFLKVEFAVAVSAVCLFLFAGVVVFGGSGEWQKLKAKTDKDLWGVCFAGKKYGWIVGDDGLILRTSDGGKKWKALKSETNLVLRGVDFVNAKQGWVVGGGGKLVKGQPRGKGRPPSMAAAICLHTSDGGKTWQEQRTGNQNFPFWQVEMIDAKNGWNICGLGRSHPDGHFHRTSDGGKSWSSPPAPYGRPARPLYDVCFVDLKNGWCVGSHSMIRLSGGNVDSYPLYKNKKGAVIHTTDGGNTWEVQHPGNPKDVYLFGVSFISRKTGWVVGEKGSIYHTTDGGKTWKQQKSGTTNHIRDVAFTDKKNGCAVCDGGVVLTTTDGGKKWKAKRVSEKDLRAVSFPKKDICVVVGDGGTVLKRKFK